MKKNNNVKWIITEENSEESYIVLKLDDYENLLFQKDDQVEDLKNLTEEQLLEKINKDISYWKSNQKSIN